MLISFPSPAGRLFGRTGCAVGCLAVVFFAFPSFGNAWPRETHQLILEDSAQFSPTWVRNLLERHAQEIPGILAALHKERPRDANLVFGDAARTLALPGPMEDRKLRVLLELSRTVLDASSPAGLPDGVVNQSTTCLQAEWDGSDDIENLASRLAVTRDALAPFKERLRNALGTQAGRNAAAEALATCYHVAVNDMADAFYSVGRRSNGDTSAWLVSRGERVWHPSTGGLLMLPRGFDPIPTLAAYYAPLRNEFALKRIRSGEGVPPPPESFYILPNLPVVVTSEGQRKIKEWQESHPPAEGAASKDARPDTPPSAWVPRRGRTDGVQERNLADETPPPFPAAAPAAAPENSGLDKDEVSRVVHSALPRIEAAYKQYLRKGQRSGTIVAEFVVTPKGRVGEVSLSDDEIGDKELQNHLTKIFEALEFPAFQGGSVRIRYPLQFRGGSSNKGETS